jgi:hypothetical protein
MTCRGGPPVVAREPQLLRIAADKYPYLLGDQEDGDGDQWLKRLFHPVPGFRTWKPSGERAEAETPAATRRAVAGRLAVDGVLEA